MRCEKVIRPVPYICWPMNKRIFLFASLCIVAADLIMWTLLRMSPTVHDNGMLSSFVQIFLTVFGLPVRLYVALVLGENGSWGIAGLPILVALVMASGALWGFIIERAWYFFKRTRTAAW